MKGNDHVGDVTIRDVARRAGVSLKTVSNVVNDLPIVRPETRARVEEAITVLGYRRNAAARSLRTRRSQAIGLILTSLSNPFYPEVLRGVQNTADASGFAVIVGNTESKPTRERGFVELLLERRVDGIILQSVYPSSDSLDLLLRAGLPLVALTTWPGPLGCDQVLADGEQGAYGATTHLLALGHRRIAHLAGPAWSDPGTRRCRGYRRALIENGISIDPQLMIETDFDRSGGRLGVRQLLEHHIDFTAIFAVNDLVAFGALDALHKNGLHVPNDVSLVGFDDVAEATDIEPKLTTVVNPAYDLGVQAARLLLERIGGQATEPRRITLANALMVRESTGPVHRFADNRDSGVL